MIFNQNFTLLTFICFGINFKICNLQELCSNDDLITSPRRGMNDTIFWSSKVQDLEQCAKLCVRRKICQSITYNTQNGSCELNSGIKTQESTIRGDTLIYSEYSWWPSSLDKHCYSRPCKEVETCIPGSILGGTSECNFSCLPLVRDVCPLPSFGVSKGRTVGSVNIYTCPKGYDGGGNATCLASKQWDRDINTNCILIFGAECKNDEMCTRINGKCSEDGNCKCDITMTYNENKKECEMISVIFGAECKSDELCARINGECSKDGHCTCDITMTYNEKEKECEVKSACGEPPVVSGATVTDSGHKRQYTCKEPDLYPIPSPSGDTITCDETSLQWLPEGFRCGGMRLVHGNVTNMKKIPMSGYLEMFIEGEWRTITYEEWTWKETMVACNKLFGFKFGGTYHKNWYGIEKQTSKSKMSSLKDIGCTGEEDLLEACPNFKAEQGKVGMNIALTCFSSNITGTGNVKLSNDNQLSGTVKISFNDTNGGFCGNKWTATETRVACKTINASYIRQSECIDMCNKSEESEVTHIHASDIRCTGDEPHLFFCRNQGWGYEDCSKENLVNITCVTARRLA